MPYKSRALWLPCREPSNSRPPESKNKKNERGSVRARNKAHARHMSESMSCALFHELRKPGRYVEYDFLQPVRSLFEPLPGLRDPFLTNLALTIRRSHLRGRHRGLRRLRADLEAVRLRASRRRGRFASPLNAVPANRLGNACYALNPYHRTTPICSSVNSGGPFTSAPYVQPIAVTGLRSFGQNPCFLRFGEVSFFHSIFSA